MRVLAVVPSFYDTSPGQRFRIEQWAPALAAAGIDIEYAPFENRELHDVLYRSRHTIQKAAQIGSAFVRRARLRLGVHRFDLVYLFREAALLGPAIVERWLAASGVPLVFDFDDAVFEPYVSPSNGRLSLLKCPGKTATVCRLAAHVMAGNAYLAQYARQYNDRVTIVPTTIDVERYQPVARAPNRPLVVGWSGSHSTAQHLRGLDRALQRLAATHPFRLRVIGAPGYDIAGVDVDALPWRAATEVEDLAQIDVGIMPLPDDRWSRGKCGLKALQYMALGIPTICSPVGVNTDIIRDGENGLLAATEDEWVRALTQLLESDDLRARLGAAGRATVEQRYSSMVHAPMVGDLFQSVVRSRASRNGVNGAQVRAGVWGGAPRK